MTHYPLDLWIKMKLRYQHYEITIANKRPELDNAYITRAIFGYQMHQINEWTKENPLECNGLSYTEIIMGCIASNSKLLEKILPLNYFKDNETVSYWESYYRPNQNNCRKLWASLLKINGLGIDYAK